MNWPTKDSNNPPVMVNLRALPRKAYFISVHLIIPQQLHDLFIVCVIYLIAFSYGWLMKNSANLPRGIFEYVQRIFHRHTDILS